MARITLRQLLDHAAEHEYGVPAFNLNNMEQGLAIMAAADATDSPVILQASRGARAYANDIVLAKLIDGLVEIYPHIPVCMHLDHGNNEATCATAIQYGFTSVMMDGSLKADGKTPADYNYNVEITRNVTKMAHWAGVSVEGELGVLGSLESGQGEAEDGHGAEGTLSHDQLLTDPEEAVKFVQATKVDALAVAMGIGRFAFTPLMPLMLRDGTLTAATGAEWAAANYAGYFLGALTASRFSRTPRRGLLFSLLGVVVTTLAMAAAGGAPDPVGAGLRALAGVFSAWCLVCASGWCLAELARRRVPQRGAWIFTGVGIGIALAGALAWLGGRLPADRLWIALGALAALGTILVLILSRGQGAPPAEPVARGAAAVARAPHPGTLGLVLCYGTFGFGYIVPATFLPAMARALTPDPLVFGLAWPLFGLAAALSVAAVAGWLPGLSRLRLWALAQGVMALGTALPLLVPTLWALAASAILVGGTVMVATMAGLQLAREARPDDPTPLLSRMTAAFAAGQILGPLLVRALGGGGPALDLTGGLATLLLVLTALWLWRAESRRGPPSPAPGPIPPGSPAAPTGGSC